MNNTTPARDVELPVRDGVRLLRKNPDIAYRDGAEERLLEIVRSADDVTSESTEMLEVAHGWAEQYHTHPARANILRSLEISPDAKVLEVGAGCGPITRYLGEVAGLVDSVEPVLSRALVGRERTRDQANVAVFAGHLEDIPAEPIYDLVVIVGVLEYVGGGDPNPELYRSFLQECRARIRPGGALVLAIENKLGVKYLTGTAEDHSGRMFDSVEDYPRGGPARTFAATALLDLVTETGYAEPRLFGVFPDYKHTRVVFDTDELHRAAPSLVEELPSFPSRFAGTRSIKLASEQRVWRELVRDGLGAHFSNSFLVLAPVDEPTSLWPTGRLARYFSVNRRRQYAATTTVGLSGECVQFDRTYSDVAGPMIADGVTRWQFVAGRTFPSVFYESDDSGRRELLERWRDLVQESSAGDRISLDAIPTNVIVRPDGDLALIDLEFHRDGSVDEVIERGLFWLARHIVRDTPPEAWSPARTVGDVYLQLAASLGFQATEGVAAMLEREAAFQLTVTTNQMGPDAATETFRALQEIYDSEIWDMPLGRRLHHLYDDAVAVQERHDAEQFALKKRLESERQKRSALRSEVKMRRRDSKQLKRTKQRLKEFESSRAHRLTEKWRRAALRIRRNP